ncbi:hypothetical protein Tco_0460931 [Tanacetum coccineum]
MASQRLLRLEAWMVETALVKDVDGFLLVAVRCLGDYAAWYVHFEELDAYVTVRSLAKLSEVAEPPRLEGKMKYVFGRSRGEDESFAGLMHDLCFSLRISLSKKRRLVAELEAVRGVEGATKCVEHMRVIVAHNAVTCGELETLLARAQVGHGYDYDYVFATHLSGHNLTDTDDCRDEKSQLLLGIRRANRQQSALSSSVISSDSDSMHIGILAAAAHAAANNSPFTI